MEVDEFEVPDSMSGEDRKIVEALTGDEIQKIDGWVKESVESRWKKVAMIVGRAIERSEQEGVLLDVPDLFFAERIHHYCDIGEFELRGDRARMRYSEVRLHG